MRIISGKHRGRKIETLKSKALRPTTGIAREALFNILSHGNFTETEGPFLEGCKVLDLFCGCGALSVESLSRGANKVVLLDIDQKHLNIAKKNIESLGEEKNATFIRADSSSPPPAYFECNLIFLDPPYNKNLANITLSNLTKGGWIAKDAIIVIETGRKESLQIDKESFLQIDERKYENSLIKFLKKVS